MREADRDKAEGSKKRFHLWGENRFEPWLEARTRRSFARIQEAAGLEVLVRSGCWHSNPSESLTRLKGWGTDVISIGLDRSAWSLRMMKRFGGDFGQKKGWKSPFDRLPPVCVIPSGCFTSHGKERGGLEERALQILRSGKWRVVHVPELDVGWDSRIRLAQVVTSIQRGGAEKLALDLAEQLSGEQCSSLLVSLGRSSRSAYRPQCPWVDLAGEPDRFTHLEGVLEGYGADLVHAHLLSADLLRRLKGHGWKVVTTLHNTHHAWPTGVGMLGREEMDLWIACSKAVELEWGTHDRVRTVWNGVAAPAVMESRESWRSLLGAGQSDLVLVALANMRPQKNFESLSPIWDAVRKKLGANRVCRLWVAGDGTLQRQWPEGVCALGCIEDVGGFLKAGDVLISPSHHEGLSLVHLEALASGIRVVATRVGGAAEVEGVCTVDPGSSPEVFAASILSAVGANPSGLASSFRLETMVRRHLGLYDAVLRTGMGLKREADGVWLITNHLGTGGAQSSAIRFMLALKKMGIRVFAAVMEEKEERPSIGTQFLRRSGIAVWCMPKSAGPVDAVKRCDSLRASMSAEQGGSVLFWNLRPVCKVLLADGLIDFRVWDVSPGEMNFDSMSRYFAKPLPGLPYLTAREYGVRLTGAVVKYEGERERAERVLGCPVAVIPNGVPCPERAGTIPKGPLRFLTVARLNPDKKLEELLDAWRRIEPMLGVGVTLHIAGGCDGDQNKEYEKALRGSTRGLRVVWHGHVEDVPGFLRVGHVFVLISEPAGCPNAGLEALAAGLPVLATNHGGASEQVIDGWNGFLVPRGDSEGLGVRMLQLAGNERMRLEMSRNSFHLASERFSMDRMVNAYLDLMGHDRRAILDVVDAELSTKECSEEKTVVP